jgi:GntR family transcriptional regulator, transcriptional repressor for pyruvate dehydrogenase complex
VLIAEVTGSTQLVEQERAIQEQFNVLYRTLPPLVQPVGTLSMDHDPLLLALRTHDSDRARNEMIEHIESTHAWQCSLLRVKKLV